ncbi:hypothetical protein HHI36_013929 [Cryptolaemus montrouzieri]|uniref:LRRCT domain-containing protein n=1 Tax=Cryptolaemus montrouzieri TaxID=559131 RepID=A0ABD2N2B5_9CUCU
MKFVPDCLGVVKTLEVLIMDSNPIYEMENGCFDAVPNLVELSLNNLNDVVEVHSNTFAPLKKLIKLHISNNKKLEYIEPDAFGEGQDATLKEVYMRNNALFDIPSVLLDWTKLHVFEFNDNPLVCSCNLRNISKLLSDRITRNKAGPYCIGRESRSYQVFSLDDQVCHPNYIPDISFTRTFKSRFSAIRIALVTTTIAAVLAVIVVIVICFAKQRKHGIFGRNELTRSTAVLYNPLNNQPNL